MKDENIDKEIEHFFNLSEKAKRENLSKGDIGLLKKGIQTYLDAIQSADDDTLINNHIKAIENKVKFYDYKDIEVILVDLREFIFKALDEKDKIIELAIKHGSFDEEDKETANKFISYTKIQKDIINILTLELKLSALTIQKIAELNPTIDRKIKGKSPKKKKDDRIKAEELAKELWAKAPEITQENMAYQIKDKLDLTQTIQTIIRWIKPYQPPK